MGKFFRRLRFVLQVHRSIPFLIDFFRSGEVAAGQKLLSVGLIAVYFLLPFDLVPDFLVFFGIVDDVAVLAFILQWMVKVAPDSLKKKHQLLH